MTALLAAIAVWIAGGVLSLLAGHDRARAAWIGATAAVTGALLGAVAAIPAILGGAPQLFRAAWSVPYAALTLRLDPLAAAFLLPLSVIGAACAVSGFESARAHPDDSPGVQFAAYNVLLAAMALVITSSNLVLLLTAWEGMTLASYALVVSDDTSRAARRAGFTYLVFSHLAAGALLVLFVLLAAGAGNWEIATLPATRAAAAFGWLFVLALIGFGTKAAIVPFHVWLPGAHAAAPAHVSALMSGVMITLGFYGLARFLPILGPPSAAVAFVLIALGAAGAFTGVLLALVQRDAKRVLAYSTVDNAGLVTLAIGVGVLGQAMGAPRIAVLGWTAALVHVWTHALGKALLFGGIGAIAHAAETRDLEHWGGMLRRWPALGALTIGGGMAIAAVPGLSGFVGEWLIFLALFESALTLAGGARVVALIAIVAVAITAAFTVACYVRLLGIGLLGARRGGEPAGSHAAPGRATIVPLAVLAALCVLAAWFPQGLAHALAGPVRLLVPRGDSAAPAESLRPLGAFSIALAGVVTLFAAARAALMRRGPRRASVTWDCGYAHPDPRMQYTASSLSQPVSGWFAPVLQTRIEAHGLSGPWPSDASWRSRTADQAMTGVYQPALGGVSRMLLGLRDLQQPDVTSYLRYVGLALLVALALLFLPIVARP